MRALVNTPTLVGEGMNLVAFGNQVSAESRRGVNALLAMFGRRFEVSDAQMDFWCAICAAGPTYVFPVIEALASAAMARRIQRARVSGPAWARLRRGNPELREPAQTARLVLLESFITFFFCNQLAPTLGPLAWNGACANPRWRAPTWHLTPLRLLRRKKLY